jgi:hypothetical protein
MTPIKQYSPLILTLLVATLVGCGGGSGSNSSSNTTEVQAGEVQTSSILVNGVEVQKTSYRVYSVSDNQGDLTDTPLANAEQEALLPKVLIADPVTSSSASGVSTSASSMAYLQSSQVLPSTVAEYKACYTQFWQGMQRYYPTKDKAFIAKRLSDLNLTVDELCIKQASSKLTMDEYIQMFEVAIKYWPNDNLIAGKIADFFMNIKVAPGTFKQTLTELGYSWEDFAARLSNDPKGRNGFANDYEESTLVFKDYLQGYMLTQQPGSILASIKLKLKHAGNALAKGFSMSAYAQTPAPGAEVTAYADAADKVIDATRNAFKLMKEVWTFIDPGDAQLNIDAVTNGQGVPNYIISANETSTLNYEFAKASQTPVITFLGESWRGEAYRINMVVAADYDAKNANIPGQWLPNFRVMVKSATVSKGYTISGTASVSSVVNRGANAAPIPEAQIDLSLAASNWSINRKSFSFIVNGATGAAYKP